MEINFFKILECWFYLAAMIACLIWIIGEMIHSLMKMCHKKKAAGCDDGEKFSMVAVIYLIFIYGHFLLWWMRVYTQQFFQFTCYTWMGNMLFYYLSSAGILCMGIFNLANAAFLHERGKAQEIKRIWIVLKIGMIPFYLLNVVHYISESKVPAEMCWTSIFSYAFLISLAPYMIVMFPCVLIFLNGCIGWYYIYHLRKTGKMEKHSFWIHCVLQVFPILDLVSMVMILKKKTGGI